MSNVEKLDLAYKAQSKARDNVSKVLKSGFPVGSQIAYRKGGSWCHASVVEHGYSDSLKVCGVSGTEFWLNGHRLL